MGNSKSQRGGRADPYAVRHCDPPSAAGAAEHDSDAAGWAEFFWWGEIVEMLKGQAGNPEACGRVGSQPAAQAILSGLTSAEAFT